MIDQEGQPMEEGNEQLGRHGAPAESQGGDPVVVPTAAGPSRDLPAAVESPHRDDEHSATEPNTSDAASTCRLDGAASANPLTPTAGESFPSPAASEIRSLDDELRGPDEAVLRSEPSRQPTPQTTPSAPKKPPGLRPEPPSPQTPLLQIQIQIPNGMVGRAYNAAVSAGVHKSSELPYGYRLEDLTVRPLRADGLEPIGLRDQPDGYELRIVGDPQSPGEHPVLIHFTVLLRGEHWISAQKQILLTINPDPRSLWKEIEPDPTAPFRRPHLRQERKVAEAVLIAASRRGRSHANKGEHRDDDFRIAHSLEKGWYAIAVADGAGSAPLSRRGAEIACISSVDALKPHLGTTLDQTFHRVVESYAEGNEASREAIHDALCRSLGDGGRCAYRTILAEASQHGRPIEQFATTLILTIARRYPCGWFVAAISVGDGGAGACRDKGEVVVLSHPDSGEFAGQTRFVTMSKIWDGDGEVRSRIRFAVVPDLVGLVAMTDGVSDPKFPTERDFFDPARWDAFWAELSGAVGLTKTNESAASELLDWLAFWAVGSHDDRTIAILLP